MADPNPGSVVSDDHAKESLNAEAMGSAATLAKRGAKPCPRVITAEEVREHTNSAGSFWAVIDSFVVDATDFVDGHPGGIKKLLATDTPVVGATGKPFGFSFSRGRNAHIPDTAQRFRDGVLRFLGGTAASDGFLQPTDVAFPPDDKKIVILGRLEGT